MNLPEKILLVDDDPDHLNLVERYAASLGIAPTGVGSAAEAMECLQHGSFPVMVTDMVMPTMDGMQLLGYTKGQHPEVDVVVMTGFSKKYSYTDVIAAGASDFIAKPFNKDELAAKLSRIGREKALIARLQRAKEIAEEASKSKTVFLSTISHELRTPMNAIIGFTDLLIKMDLPAKSHEFLQMISDSAIRLTRLINQLLNFSSLDAGTYTLRPSEFTLQGLFVNLIVSFEEKAKNKGLTMGIDIPPALSEKKLFADTHVLAQTLSHLVDNAVKFSDHGTITIAAHIKESSLPDSLVLEFTVTDNGVGVTQEKIAHIFTPFTQGENYMTRRHDGLGLGLAICAKLVNLLGGTMWAKSHVGCGSTFFFTAKILVV